MFKNNFKKNFKSKFKNLTRLASDLGLTRHKYHRMVHKYLVWYISRRLTTILFFAGFKPPTSAT